MVEEDVVVMAYSYTIIISLSVYPPIVADSSSLCFSCRGTGSRSVIGSNHVMSTLVSPSWVSPLCFQ